MTGEVILHCSLGRYWDYGLGVSGKLKNKSAIVSNFDLVLSYSPFTIIFNNTCVFELNQNLIRVSNESYPSNRLTLTALVGGTKFDLCKCIDNYLVSILYDCR